MGVPDLTGGPIRFNLTCMRSLRRARWLGAVLIAPVLALAVAASSQLALRCSMTGMLIRESCCPAADDGGARAEPVPHASIVDPGCCERLVVSTGKLPATTSDRTGVAPALSVSSASAHSALALDAASPRFPAARRVARPPGIDAPAFLLRHSFLI